MRRDWHAQVLGEDKAKDIIVEVVGIHLAAEGVGFSLARLIVASKWL